MAGVGRQQEQQRDEKGPTTREKQPGLGSSSRCPQRPWMLALKTKPDKVPDRAEDRKECNQEAVPGTKHERQGACQQGGSQRDYGKGATRQPVEDLMKKESAGLLSQQKRGSRKGDWALEEQAAPILRGLGQPKKSPRPLILVLSNFQRPALGQAPSESIRLSSRRGRDVLVTGGRPVAGYRKRAGGGNSGFQEQ